MSEFDLKIPLKYYPATLLSQQHCQPHSTQFDDIYFNTENGLAESNYVFIQGNELLKRWQQSTDKTNFVIAETGFGTGLNFLATLDAWHQAKEKPAQLHYISLEKYPLHSTELEAAHSAFPVLGPYSEQLNSHWQQFNNFFRHGLHQLNFSDDVTLTLGFGDAAQLLKQLNAKVDAWYLDGFAPKKNPEMWHQNLYSEINRHSHPSTTIATFTAASQVKKDLLNNGFEVNKKPGFGKKREMITAEFKQDVSNPDSKPWCPMPPQLTKNQNVTILGAGIAGLCLAERFKQQGYHTTVIEKNTHPMMNASGNAMAMVMPLLTAENAPESQFYLRAFETAKRFYRADEYHEIGVQQHLTNNKKRQWAKSISNLGLPDSLINCYNDNEPLMLYPSAGYVETQIVADRLSSHVDQWHHLIVDDIEANENGQWLLKNTASNTVIEAELLIIANGIHAQQSFPNLDLSLTAKHGMTSIIENKDVSMSHIQLADGYIIPEHNSKRLLCGATFDHLPQSAWYQPAQLQEDHWRRNKQLWQYHKIYPKLESAQLINAHAAIRATTPDHLPICGPMIDQRQFRKDYDDLHHGRHWQQYPTAAVYDNLYLLNGLGSRGFTSAPLLAQYLCAMICGEPLPLENDLCKIMHPNRFLYRSLKKPPK